MVIILSILINISLDKIMYGFIKRVFIGLLSVCILIRFGRPLASNYK